MRKLVYVALIAIFLVGIFAALYLRQIYGFAVAGAAVLAFTYIFIRGKE